MDPNAFAFKFDFPTKWRHGRGCASQTGGLAKELGMSKALIVTDKVLVDLDVLDPVYKSMQEAGVAYDVCDEVAIEPTTTLFDTLMAKMDLSQYDGYISVGGGSPMDVAKAFQVVGQFGGHLRDYVGPGKVPGELKFPHIAIPTTSGTGSEVSPGSVWIDDELQTKTPMVDIKLCPTFALTDPEMTKTMPPKVTAYSGIDALVHAIESYMSKDSSPASEPFALQAIKMIGQGLEKAMENGDDLDARENMQLGSTLAMVSTVNALLGLCHAMAMPLCAMYGMPHGLACGMVQPYVLKYNAEVVPQKVVNVFKALGYISETEDVATPPQECYERFIKMVGDIGVGVKLTEFGYKEEDMPKIVAGTINSVMTNFNPRKPTESEVEALIREVV